MLGDSLSLVFALRSRKRIGIALRGELGEGSRRDNKNLFASECSGLFSGMADRGISGTESKWNAI